MKKVYIGKTVSTHGIKGEIKIISDFPYKDKVFVKGMTIFIDDKEYIINTYRHHKIYDMVTLNNYNDINEVFDLLKKRVYINEDELVLDEDEILDEDLIKYEVVIDNKIGSITEIFQASKDNKILRIEISNKEILVPYNSPMVIKIDKSSKKIYIKLIDGMVI